METLNFKSWLNESSKVQLNNENDMSGELSIDLYYRGGEKAQLSIWVNAGTAYRYLIDEKIAETLEEKSYKEREKIANNINKKVALLIEKELNKIL